MSPESIVKPNELDHGAEIKSIHDLVAQKLIDESVEPKKITDGEVRSESILYLIYWHNRLKNNPQEQGRIHEHLVEYLGSDIPNHKLLATDLAQNEDLAKAAKEYVETLLLPRKTVDLVVIKSGSEEQRNKDVLCIERDYFPFGLALPGGFIKDTDEDNELGVSPEIFAALRVAGEKVLGLGQVAKYDFVTDSHGKKCYLVHGEAGQPIIRLYPEDEGGYHYRENIKTILRPSDPRHIVDTIGFRCVLEGEAPQDTIWKNKTEIMDPEVQAGGFAFGHHREIVAYIASLTSDEKARNLVEHEYIRKVIKDPIGTYSELADRFEEAGFDPETSFPELLPIVTRLQHEMFTEEINEMCKKTPILIGLRDNALNELRHVRIFNRIVCPYQSTLRAISSAVAFFDIIARQKKGFFDNLPSDEIIEHNPAQTKYAKYHSYRYQYRFNQLISLTPDEIIIPTFEPLSATDLLKVRGVPIRFVGISPDFLYVDEFEQSPDEFYKHDMNHSWRMAMEDMRMLLGQESSLTMEDLFTSGILKQKLVEARKYRMAMIQESNHFISEYLETIKIRKTDTEEEREIKKLKKIILFEIVHEDARPFLKDIVCKFIQVMEGGDVPFEVPRIDYETGSMDVVDTIDTGISTLSYVRNKLQHGFYDQTDAQLPQIVDPKYRTSKWIARAAYEMLVELDAKPDTSAELDEHGHVAYDWLLKRTVAVGPDNVHDATVNDELVTALSDGADALNEKRYQANQKK